MDYVIALEFQSSCEISSFLWEMNWLLILIQQRPSERYRLHARPAKNWPLVYRQHRVAEWNCARSLFLGATHSYETIKVVAGVKAISCSRERWRKRHQRSFAVAGLECLLWKLEVYCKMWALCFILLRLRMVTWCCSPSRIGSELLYTYSYAGCGLFIWPPTPYIFY